MKFAQFAGGLFILCLVLVSNLAAGGVPLLFIGTKIIPGDPPNHAPDPTVIEDKYTLDIAANSFKFSRRDGPPEFDPYEMRIPLVAGSKYKSLIIMNRSDAFLYRLRDALARGVVKSVTSRNDDALYSPEENALAQYAWRLKFELSWGESLGSFDK